MVGASTLHQPCANHAPTMRQPCLRNFSFVPQSVPQAPTMPHACPKQLQVINSALPHVNFAPTLSQARLPQACPLNFSFVPQPCPNLAPTLPQPRLGRLPNCHLYLDSFQNAFILKNIIFLYCDILGEVLSLRSVQ